MINESDFEVRLRGKDNPDHFVVSARNEEVLGCLRDLDRLGETGRLQTDYLGVTGEQVWERLRRDIPNLWIFERAVRPSSSWKIAEVAGKQCNVMPIDGSVDLPKLLKHFRDLVTELWEDLNMLKEDTMTLKVAVSSCAFEAAEVMVRSGFKEFVIAVRGEAPSE